MKSFYILPYIIVHANVLFGTEKEADEFLTQFYEELDKEYDLSPEQEREVIKYITKSAEHNINTIKKLSEAQKKQFMQEFKESLYDR